MKDLGHFYLLSFTNAEVQSTGRGSYTNHLYSETLSYATDSSQSFGHILIMVMDALVYHPTVAHYLRFVATTGNIYRRIRSFMGIKIDTYWK